MKKRWPIIALLLVTTAVAIARPGGGGSFSGGGGHSSGGGGSFHSSGGGGGSGDGIVAIFELLIYLIQFIAAFPLASLVILGGVIAYLIVNSIRKARNKDWDSGPPAELQQAVELGTLQRIDPDFSPIAFEDFLYRLFATAHRLRDSADHLLEIAPYVSAGARTQLAARTPGEQVRAVIVGAMRIYRLDLPGATSPATVIGVEFEANVLTDRHTYYSVENWLLNRAAGVVSKPPAATRTFPCPNCGAPWEPASTGTQQCASCGQVVDNGRFDWLVNQVALISVDERPPTIGGEVAERGNDLPTYRQSDVESRWASLRAADPGMSEPALFARLGMIYTQLNTAWASNDLTGARGVVSDGIYDYLNYWIDTYKAQGVRNALEDMRITHSTIAKVASDKWFTAITIRIFATGKDYTVRTKDNAVIKGSKRFERTYTEYWTLIRSASRTGEPKAAAACPNCGAPLAQINQGGTCAHCNAHVTSGEFDWVLSKIEQDDTYRG